MVRAGGTALVGAMGTTLLASCATDGGSEDSGQYSAPGNGGSKQEPLSPFLFLSFPPLTSFTVSPAMLGDVNDTFEKHGSEITREPATGSAQVTQMVLANNGQVARNGLINATMARFNENQDIVLTAVDTYSVGIRIVTIDAAPNPAD